MASSTLVDAQNIQTILSFNFTNGANPSAAMILGMDGTLYGTTANGGITNSTDYTNGMGTVFQLTTNGTLTTLDSFNFTNGASPNALTLDNAGNIYGTTVAGGLKTTNYPGGMGTIFQVTTDGTLSTLYSFTDGTDAALPSALTLGKDGLFYGTTTASAAYERFGTVFKATTNGTLTTLSSTLYTDEADRSALALGNDGNFYATTYESGIDSDGSIIQVTTEGVLTTLVSFTSGNGANPAAGLTLGNDGNFYGTTDLGGSQGYGTIFKVTTNGALATLYSFTNGSDGAYPEAALTLGNDGNFYGTASEGGSDDYGTIFQVATNGTLTVLASFSGTNGAYPHELTLGSDGNFYGTTFYGGATNMGTVFRLLFIPTITIQPQNQTSNAGATVTFSVTATSLFPTSYQWQENGTNLADGGNVSGATNSTLTITDISDSDAASYSVIVSNVKGSVSSAGATLTVVDAPSITAQPTNMVVLTGTVARFAVSATGSASFYYQWQFNGDSLVGGTNAVYTISSVETNNAGYYSVVVSNSAGALTSSNATLTAVVSPASQTDYASSSATFTVTAVSPDTLNYQWQENGTNLIDGGNISGATNDTLTIASVSDSDAATYTVVVSDGSDDVTTTNATLTVNDMLLFAAQPLSQTAGAGSMVTFTTTVYGAAPFLFQWYFNSNPIGSPTAGTNYSSYTLTDVGTNQAGDYSVQVFNGAGSLTSSNAVLTVVPQPELLLKVSAGYPLLSLYGTPGDTYQVQYSTNLAQTNWINLSLIDLSTNLFQFLDPGGFGQPARFYRAFFTK
jgi:uncharacterized repeat protein (TIGR03803 family)